MSDGPTLQIPRDVIEPIIQAQIAASLASALGADGVLRKAVNTILQTPVDSEGKASGYSSDRNRPWIDWAISDALRIAARKAIEQAVEQQGEVIRKELAAQLTKKNSPLIKQMIEAMMTGVFNANQVKYEINITAK